MHRKGGIKATMRDARRRARRAIEEARRQAADAPGDASSIDVAARTNIISTTNIGRDGAAQAASAEQAVEIRQSNHERPAGDER